MVEPKPTVYIETSIISYLTARLSRDIIIAGHQQITRDWWEEALPNYNAVISRIVLEEISRGDAQAAQRRLAQVSDFPLLQVTSEVSTLADIYFEALQIPERARADSYHLALASWHGIDFLLSWNCTHIVNASFKRLINRIDAQQGINTPIICTPEELMESLR